MSNIKGDTVLKTTHAKAAIVRKPNSSFNIENVLINPPKDDEVLVRIVATGMCHTDLIARDQLYPVPLPAILGHEGAGVIEQVGENVDGLKSGDHVVLSFGSCHSCEQCVSGSPAYCQNFFTLNFQDDKLNNRTFDSNNTPVYHRFFSQSSFSSYCIAKCSDVVKVTKDADLKYLGPLGCGIQTGAGAVMNSLKITSGSSFACFGAGAVGLSAIMAAKVCGASTIIAIDVVESRLKLAKDLGATHVLNANEVNIIEEIKQITGHGVKYALESTGRPATLTDAVKCLGYQGALGVVGAPKLGTHAEFDVNDLLLSGKTIRGIVEGDSVPKIFINQLIELFLSGRFPFDKLVKFYSFEEINLAAMDSESGLTIKPIILF
jgi:aryl-alcohol dehydrogenase